MHNAHVHPNVVYLQHIITSRFFTRSLDILMNLLVPCLQIDPNKHITMHDYIDVQQKCAVLARHFLDTDHPQGASLSDPLQLVSHSDAFSFSSI